MNASSVFPNLRRHRAGIHATLVTALALLAGPLAPLRADVIDDFEHGREFYVWGEFGVPAWQFVNGELKINLPPPPGTSQGPYASFLYEPRVYELPEGQPVEFRLDLVSINANDAYLYLGADFATGQAMPKAGERRYTIYVLYDRVLLQKGWDGKSSWFFNTDVPWSGPPKTVSLTLTREGDNLRIGVKVVQRDNPQKVLFSQEVIDGPGQDPVIDGDLDPGPSPPGAVMRVLFGCSTLPPSSTAAQVVVDNFVCSEDPTPIRLQIQRKGDAEAFLAWPGNNILLESDSVQGPWRPSPERRVPGVGEYTGTVPLGASARYFRLQKGFHAFDHFEGGTDWRIVSVLPSGGLPPLWNYYLSQSRGRILGTGPRNADFVLRHNVENVPHAGIWYRDAVAAVDIVGWGDAMEDATFGILLRVKPARELWFSDVPGLPDQRYAGLLTFKKADNPAESALSITGPGGALIKEQRFPAVDKAKTYRLRFWTVGDQLTIELFDRENLATPIQAFTVTDGRIPQGMDGLCGTKSAGGTYEVWIDQYLLNATRVW